MSARVIDLLKLQNENENLQVIVSGIAPPTPPPISVTPRRIDDSELLRNIRKG